MVIGYFSRRAAELAERDNADNSYSSAKAQLKLRIQELQLRLAELSERSRQKPLCFQNETERRLTDNDLNRLRPEDLCTADEVFRAIDRAKQQLAFLEGQSVACFADMIPGQMMLSAVSTSLSQKEKEIQEGTTRKNLTELSVMRRPKTN